MQGLNYKDKIDRLNILEKSELIKSRSEEIKAKYRSVSNKKAFEIASKEILKGEKWNY